MFLFGLWLIFAGIIVDLLKLSVDKTGFASFKVDISDHGDDQTAYTVKHEVLHCVAERFVTDEHYAVL